MGHFLTLVIVLALDFLATAGLLWVIFWALGALGVVLAAPFIWSWGLSFFIWIIIKCLKLLF